MIPNAIEITILVLCIILIVALMNLHSMSNYLAKWRLGISDDHDQGLSEEQDIPDLEEPKA